VIESSLHALHLVTAVNRRTTSAADRQALMTIGPRFTAATPQGEEPTPARVTIKR